MGFKGKTIEAPGAIPRESSIPIKEKVDALATFVDRIEKGEDLAKPSKLYLKMEWDGEKLKIIEDEFKPLEYPFLVEEIFDLLEDFEGDQDRLTLHELPRKFRIEWDVKERVVKFTENEFSFMELQSIVKVLSERYEIQRNF